MPYRNPHKGGEQLPLIVPDSAWQAPVTLPDLRSAKVIAIDLETRDDGIGAGRGSGWVNRAGHICGVAIAWDGGSLYVPLNHPDTDCSLAPCIGPWLQVHVNAGVRFVTQSGLYDWGWIRSELGIKMPSSDQLDDTSAMATMVDENRLEYNLDALCKWQGIAGKDTSLLTEACVSYGFNPKDARGSLWKLPARFVGPYAEADAIATLELSKRLMKTIHDEETLAAYRLEIDLLPMIQEMRVRGIRVDLDAAAKGRDLLLKLRDETLAELTDNLGERVSMEEIGSTKWLSRIFDAARIEYPRTSATKRFPDGQPSFTAGSTGWMHKHQHWLPKMIVRADKYNNAATKFLQGYILDYASRGRIHAEIHPHRSDEGGTRTTRFSYSDPPLQQMTAHDPEIAPLVRGCFLPEDGEYWCKPDISQQELRLNVHYSYLMRHKFSDFVARSAKEAVAQYCENPDTDFHQLLADWSNGSVTRPQAKNINFAKSYGAGVKKFAHMIDKPIEEAEELYRRHGEIFPFMSALSEKCQQYANRRGYIRLLDGARSHFDTWEAAKWENNRDAYGNYIAPKSHAAAKLQWPDERIRRAETRKAANRLIQGGAARYVKLAMRAMWREGIVPMLQMHDEIDRSVSSEEEGIRTGIIMRDVMKLAVPMLVDVKYGKNWADAKHTWKVCTASSISGATA